MSGFLIKCDSCPATLMVNDGTPAEVAARVRSVGWTTPTPFADRCPGCTAKAAT
jgi:hypothetical protein